MNKKIIGAVVLVVIAAIVISFPGNRLNDDSIKIAFIGPLSGDGAAWGEIEKNAIQLAIDEINNSGGISGRQVDVSYEDGKCDGTTALSAAKKLVEVDGIRILLVSCSQEMASVGPYAQSNKVIAFTSYASASNITNLGSYIFRNSYTNQDMGKSMADVAFSKGKIAAIISEESAFATDLRDFFIESYKNNGGEVVASENYVQGGRDFRTQATKILSKKPSIIVVNPNGPDSGIAVMKQLRQLGYEGSFVGNFFGGSVQVQKTPEAQGMIYVSDPVFSESPIKQKVFAAYKAKYGSEPDLPWPLGARYDAVNMLKEAFTSVGSDPTDVMNYLHQMPGDFTGVLGTYRFNADNANITNVRPSVAVIKDGISIPVGN